MLIGGKIGSDTLNLNWAYDLPRRNESREDHPCATYLNQNGDLEVMVTGGGYRTETLEARKSSEVLQSWELGPNYPKQ